MLYLVCVCVEYTYVYNKTCFHSLSSSTEGI